MECPASPSCRAPKCAVVKSGLLRRATEGRSNCRSDQVPKNPRPSKPSEYRVVGLTSHIMKANGGEACLGKRRSSVPPSLDFYSPG